MCYNKYNGGPCKKRRGKRLSALATKIINLKNGIFISKRSRNENNTFIEKEEQWIAAQNTSGTTSLSVQGTKTFNERVEELETVKNEKKKIDNTSLKSFLEAAIDNNSLGQITGTKTFKDFLNSYADIIQKDRKLDKQLKNLPSMVEAQATLDELQNELAEITKEEANFKTTIDRRIKKLESKKKDLYDLLTAKNANSDKATLDKLKSEIEAIEADLALLGGLDTSTNGREINFAVWGSYENETKKPFTAIFLKRELLNIKKNYLALYIDPFEFYIQENSNSSLKNTPKQ